jgi:exodeoxyribonuclease VII large subunit
VFDAPRAALTTPVWAVSALLLAIGDAMAARFGAVVVRGELAGFSRAASGHCYFSLKDAQGTPAMLRCAMFRRAATLVDFTPGDGQQVEVRGRLGVYEARGELQFIVEGMQRVGAGTLYEEFLRLRARLEAAGLFDPARKRSIVTLPRRVAVVTSLNAAALQDVLTTLRRRSPQVGVVVVPSLVQGAEAPAALVSALTIAAAATGVETILLVRGGGALEDLWAFNDERVVRAVASSPVPVICGVGHETDITLCDLAADLRAPTPTAAAELAAPAADDLLRAIAARRESFERASRRVLDRQGQRLDQLALRLSPLAAIVSEQAQRLAAMEQRMSAALRALVPRKHLELAQSAARLATAGRGQLRWSQARLEAQEQRLAAHDPRRVLQRGYAWVETAAGRPVVAAAELTAGQTVRAVWADGSAQATIDAVRLGSEPAADERLMSAGTPPPAGARRRRRT